jgi:hypothetical protein
MRICPKIQSADAKEVSRQGELAFTMVEIAIAIGVIGFALVAIIGILPFGMKVQKDNREDTLISQDAPYFLDAIRNGAVISNYNNGSNYVAYSGQGLDFLTNYVQSIRFDYVFNGVTNANDTRIYSNFANGAEIIGLLAMPQTNFASPYFISNYFDTTATVRALSGPATFQSGLNSQMAFTYQMEVFVSPFNSFAPDTIEYTNHLSDPDPNQWIIRSNRWREAAYGALSYNLYDVRLRFSWPVLSGGRVGPNHQTYRTMVAGQMAYALSTNAVSGGFFQPQTFVNPFTNSNF